MFKRFLVIDLFHSDDENLEVKEWVDVKDRIPNQKAGIFKVKLSNGDIVSAYFCRDMCCSLLDMYKDKPSYWWDKKDGIPLYNVNHWGRFDEKENK